MASRKVTVLPKKMFKVNGKEVRQFTQTGEDQLMDHSSDHHADISGEKQSETAERAAAGNGLKVHKMIPIDKEELKYKECSKYQASHQRVHRNYNCKSYKCKVCDKIIRNRINIIRHVQSHNTCGRKTYLCDVCGKKLSSIFRLQEHMRMHTGERPFKCSVCDKAFAAESTLQGHMRIHTGERPYTCKICGKDFRTGATLRKHSKRRHPDKKQFVCNVCGGIFKIKSSLEQHLQTHTDESPFICGICRKTFITELSLRRHVALHVIQDKSEKTDRVQSDKEENETSLVVKRFTCKECGKAYCKKHSLVDHMRTHTGEKPYKCDVCEMSFV